MNFNFTEDEREMLESAFNTITTMEAWDFMKNHSPGEGGFAFSNDSKVIEIKNQINRNYPGHSGASLAYTMRKMEFIAKS